MGDWSLLEGQLVDTVGEVLATSKGTTIACGAANTKGNWIQLTAATTYAADGFCVFLVGWEIRSYLVDIGVGAPGSEQILLPDLHTGPGLALSRLDISFFPIPIPAGTRIAARAQDSSGSGAVHVTIGLFSQGFLPSAPLSRVTAYGATAADSGGVSVDPGAVAHTKNAYSQINAATVAPIRALLVAIGGQANNARTSCGWLVDVAIGAAGSEIIILPDLFLMCHFTDDHILPGVLGPFLIDIPAGTRLAARAQCSITDATDRLFDIVLYGID